MGETITRARSRRRGSAALTGALATALLLTGCGGDGTDAAPTALTATPSATAAEQTPTGPDEPDRGDGARSASPAPAPVRGEQLRPADDDGAGADQVPIEAAQPEPGAAESARSRATAFLRAFARTDLAQDTWWAGVRGYFTPAAAEIYRYTDVANVPVHSVKEGSAKLVAARSTKYRAEVTVDSNIGTYTIVLIHAGGQWLVERAIPPAGAG